MGTNRLYKYFDAKGGLAMLEHNNIQFTNATKLNDPFDCNSRLIGMGYPNSIVRKSYIGFSISPMEMDVSYLEECNLVRKLIEINLENEKGTPVFIES